MSAFNEEGLAGRGLLLYGNVSGLGFYTGEIPVISTAWPSLDSFSTDKFAAEMSGLSNRIDSEGMTLPAVIVGQEELEGILSNPVNKKQSILKDYISKYNYTEIYSGEKFTVFAVK